MSDAQLIRERDKAIKQMATLEVEVWALGVQVVAQAARLRLAEAVCDAARGLDDTAETRQLWDALAAWDAVPGMEP
jgi:hypothetical protein